ncbi:MAG: hypothetical protein ACTSSI_06310 [Candidatus Helarchaeota archaeon]
MSDEKRKELNMKLKKLGLSLTPSLQRFITEIEDKFSENGV